MCIYNIQGVPNYGTIASRYLAEKLEIIRTENDLGILTLAIKRMFPNGNYLGSDFQWGNPRFYIISSSYFPSFSIIFSWFVWGFPIIFPSFSLSIPATSTTSREGFPLGEMPQLFRMTAEVVTSELGKSENPGNIICKLVIAWGDHWRFPFSHGGTPGHHPFIDGFSMK